jgi:hypothetical protein
LAHNSEVSVHHHLAYCLRTYGEDIAEEAADLMEARKQKETGRDQCPKISLKDISFDLTSLH